MRESTRSAWSLNRPWRRDRSTPPRENVFGVLDEKLHAAIAEASHNPLLTHLNALVTVAFKQFRAHSFAVEAHAKNAVSPHRKIVRALQKRMPPPLSAA